VYTIKEAIPWAIIMLPKVLAFAFSLSQIEQAMNLTGPRGVVQATGREASRTTERRVVEPPS